MSRERTFPFEFESRKPVYFYPAQPELISGDVLEIGPGRGDLLLSESAQRPELRFVGVELNGFRFRKLSRRAAKRNLANVLLIKGNARIVIPRFFSGPTFEKIYVLFPDPWPKERHAFNRLLSIGFLQILTDILRPKGVIVVATDDAPYAEWVAANGAAIRSLSSGGIQEVDAGSILPSGEQTFFEELWREKGKRIYQLRFEKMLSGVSSG